MDTYQPIFDAVRSRINNGDVGHAVENAIRQEGIGHYIMLAMNQFECVAAEMQRPSVIFRPTLTKDGDMWCALLGPDIQVGCAGFGETPEKAMKSFDEAFIQA